MCDNGSIELNQSYKQRETQTLAKAKAEGRKEGGNRVELVYEKKGDGYCGIRIIMSRCMYVCMYVF